MCCFSMIVKPLHQLKQDPKDFPCKTEGPLNQINKKFVSNNVRHIIEGQTTSDIWHHICNCVLIFGKQKLCAYESPLFCHSIAYILSQSPITTKHFCSFFLALYLYILRAIRLMHHLSKSYLAYIFPQIKIISCQNFIEIRWALRNKQENINY